MLYINVMNVFENCRLAIIVYRNSHLSMNNSSGNKESRSVCCSKTECRNWLQILTMVSSFAIKGNTIEKRIFFILATSRFPPNTTVTLILNTPTAFTFTL